MFGKISEKYRDHKSTPFLFWQCIFVTFSLKSFLEICLGFNLPLSVFSRFYGNISNPHFMFRPCGLDTVSTNKFDLDPCKVTNIWMSDNHVSFCGVGDVERHVPVRKEIILKAQITDQCSILKQYTTFSVLYAGTCIWRWWALPWELQLFAVSLRAEQLNVKLSVGMAMQRMGNNYFHVVFMSLKKQRNYLNSMKSHYMYHY